MLYLSGCVPAKPHLRQLLVENNIGIMATPYSFRNPIPGWNWAADNGCFSNKWSAKAWLTWLKSHESPHSALFATVPDVVADHRQTMNRWKEWWSVVSDLGFKTAFVLQDGADMDEVPWGDMDALFIGGSTEYKLSKDAQIATQMAKKAGKWVHMGRVNSARRIQLAHEWGCDSVDGTFLAFAPDHNTHRLIKMLAKVNNQPLLFV